MIEDFDLPVVNRSLLTIEAKAPFVEWLNSIRGEEELNLKLTHTVESVNEEVVAYLIPELVDEEDQELFLERFWVTLFELQLSGWIRDESEWPKKRTRKMFDSWFNCKFGSLVFDLWGKDKLGYED